MSPQIGCAVAESARRPGGVLAAAEMEVTVLWTFALPPALGPLSPPPEGLGSRRPSAAASFNCNPVEEAEAGALPAGPGLASLPSCMSPCGLLQNKPQCVKSQCNRNN